MNKFLEQELKELQQKVADGNEHAFKQLFHLLYHRLLLFAFSIVKSKQLAAEIVDDVLIKVWQQKRHLLLIDNLKTYLYKAVKNTSLNYLAKKTKEDITNPFEFVDIEITDTLNAEKIFITKELAIKIQQAIMQLPPKCKVVFKLIKEDGLTYKEVAEILQISTKTVDAQMVNAITQIRKAIATTTDVTIPSKKSIKKS